MGKKIYCTVECDDWIQAEPDTDDKEVIISFSESEHKGKIFLTPSDARKLRKKIKKALEAIEGTEQESEA